jgi:uncharacterized protein (DUF697 family)
MILLLKIAAIYGKPIHLMDRFRELLPVVGGAFGWRAVARELAGYVPAGVGVAIKGTIAYAGTVAVGKGALLFYQGKLSSRDQVDQLYQQATESGRSLVSSIIESRKTGVRSSSSE